MIAKIKIKNYDVGHDGWNGWDELQEIGDHVRVLIVNQKQSTGEQVISVTMAAKRNSEIGRRILADWYNVK
jgi:hypothetical protein